MWSSNHLLGLCQSQPRPQNWSCCTELLQGCQGGFHRRDQVPMAHSSPISKWQWQSLSLSLFLPSFSVFCLFCSLSESLLVFCAPSSYIIKLSHCPAFVLSLSLSFFFFSVIYYSPHTRSLLLPSSAQPWLKTVVSTGSFWATPRGAMFLGRVTRYGALCSLIFWDDEWKPNVNVFPLFL